MDEQILNQIGLQIPAILIALFALVYSIKSYKQANKITNENILYQEKVQGYKDIMYSLCDLLNSVQLNFYFVKALASKGSLTDEELDEINDYADEIDNKTDEFDNIVKANSVILPSKILDPLEDLIADLYESQSLDNLEKNDFEQFDERIEGFLEKAEKLVKLFRKDLKSKELNETLFKRIKRIKRIRN